MHLYIMKETILFQQLITSKKRLIIPMTILFIFFYFALPFFIWYLPQWINFEGKSLFLPWWWLFAFFQLAVTWILGWVYWYKAKRHDELVDYLKQRTVK
ncbi:phage protein (superinfection immunity) [Bacillus freudenreichii]|nr:phage protein (superinfection immunity) [Bacillus freudenreichii]